MALRAGAERVTMTMSSLLGSVPLASLPEGIGRLVVLGGHEIAVFRQGSQVHAIDARCPHSGGPLAEGMVCGDVVVCPLHLRRVNLRSGEVEDWPASVRTYQVEISDGEVLIRT